MVMSLNKVMLIGNIGRDPEVRTTQEGREIASFSLATSEAWNDKSGERKEKTEWHKIVVFAKPLIDIIKKYVKKGSKLYIEGSLHTRKWQDQGGVERFTTEITIDSYTGTLIMLDAKNKDQTGPVNDKEDYSLNVANLGDDDIPF